MRKKLTYEEVKEYIESFGYKLLSNEYIRSDKKLKMECPNGHFIEMSFNNFKANHRCKKCYNHKQNEKMKLSYEEVKKYIENEGYNLLTKEYINAHIKMMLECPCGHKFEMDFNHFKSQGNRCPYCSNHVKLTYEHVKKYIENFGYELLSEKYIKNNVKLLVKCPYGHEYEVTYASFQQGNRCPECKHKINGEKKRHTYEYVKEYIEEEGYTLLSTEYKNAHAKLLVKCSNNHIYKVRFNDFKNNNSRCPECNISKGERKIIKYLENNNIEYIYEKTFDNLLGVGGRNLSYDFYLPNYNLLIEYQGGFHDGNITGNYKHTFDFERQQEHDRRKREYAEKNGYKLLEIWYWDFDNIEEILRRVTNDE